MGQIPKQCAEYWQSNVCLNFLSAFFNFVTSEFEEDSREGGESEVGVKEFSWRARDSEISVIERTDLNRDLLLPEWYAGKVFVSE